MNVKTDEKRDESAANDESGGEESKPLADAELEKATGGGRSSGGEDSFGLWQINVEAHEDLGNGSDLTDPNQPRRPAR